MHRLISVVRGLKSHSNLSRALSNTGWLVADKVVRLGVGLLVTVWIARSLGPEQFGKWNYAIAFATLFGSVATLGLDAIVVRDLVQNPGRGGRVLGTAFVLRVVAALTAVIAVTVSVSILKMGNTELIVLSMLSAGAFVFQASNVIDLHFQAAVNSKNSVIAQNAAFLVMAAVKFEMLRQHATLMQFALVTLAEAGLTAVFMFWALSVSEFAVPTSSWAFDFTYAKRMLKDGFPLILSGLAISIYYKIGVLMVGEMKGDEAVGIYTAATRISEAWYFVPMAITSSLFPIFVTKRMHSASTYFAIIQSFYTAMLLLALGVALFTTLFGTQIAGVLYGTRFKGVDTILTLHIWAGVFVCLGLASSTTLTIEGLQRLGSYRTFIGCLANVGLNWLLIPAYGGVGAAIATVISYGLSVFSIGLFPRGRKVFNMMLKSPNFFRLLHPSS